MQVNFTAAELEAIVQPVTIKGATSQSVRGIASLESAGAGDLSFLGNSKYRGQIAGCRASVLLLPRDQQGEPQADQVYFLVENPSLALARVCARIESLMWPKPPPGIHPSAVVSKGARLAPSATVGPLCVIEEGAVIGDRVHLQAQVFIGRDAQVGEDCWLMPGVTVANGCSIGKRVLLHPGVIIGADGFGYEFVKGRHQKTPQVGIVLIEDDVEIGANSTVDRARFSMTRVGEGTKIDNLVQIGHNVIIGKHCLLCAQVGIAGSSVIEDYVVLAGQAGVGGHIAIGRESKIGGQAGISSSLPAKSVVTGTPPLPFMLDRRVNVLRERLPELFKRVDALEAQWADQKKPSAG